MLIYSLDMASNDYATPNTKGEVDKGRKRDGEAYSYRHGNMGQSALVMFK